MIEKDYRPKYSLLPVTVILGSRVLTYANKNNIILKFENDRFLTLNDIFSRGNFNKLSMKCHSNPKSTTID